MSRPSPRPRGGATAARARLRQFLKKRLRGYAEHRSEPRSPEEGHASGLSPYLHFGQISIEAVVESVLATTGTWSAEDPDVNSFLDQAMTWRDVGFNWHRSRREDAAHLETALPPWVLEWSASPTEAYRTLEHLNNKYALDGRDPSSYTGILWCFGLFDRPWAPERRIFGRVRYMSSENTARKFRLGPYYAYVDGLPKIDEARSGGGALTS